MKRHPTPHPPWCAGGHRCNLAEHRAHPIVVDAGRGRATLTRVQGATGGQHAEVRLTVPLSGDDRAARDQVATLLMHLESLLTLVAAVPTTGAAALPRRVT
jgi:hypothetical protein